MLKMPEEFKEGKRMCIRWTGPNFQKMIGYFKGYKMKYIEIKQSSFKYSNEMSDFLRQSESFSLRWVNIMHKKRTLNPSQEKILTKRVEFMGLSESIANI
jgi:hypothetical protein